METTPKPQESIVHFDQLGNGIGDIKQMKNDQTNVESKIKYAENILHQKETQTPSHPKKIGSRITTSREFKEKEIPFNKLTDSNVVKESELCSS